MFKIDSMVSTKLSPDSSFVELLGRDSPFVEIDDDPVLSPYQYDIDALG